MPTFGKLASRKNRKLKYALAVKSPQGRKVGARFKLVKNSINPIFEQKSKTKPNKSLYNSKLSEETDGAKSLKHSKTILEGKEKNRKLRAKGENDISQMVLGDLQNVLMNSEIFNKPNDPYLKRKAMESKLPIRNEKGNKGKIDNSPPSKKNLTVKTEEDKKIFTRQLKNLLNVTRDIKLIDDESRKLVKKNADGSLIVLPGNKKLPKTMKSVRVGFKPKVLDKNKDKKKNPEDSGVKAHKEETMLKMPLEMKRKVNGDRVKTNYRALWREKRLDPQGGKTLAHQLKNDNEATAMFKTYILPQVMKAKGWKAKTQPIGLQRISYVDGLSNTNRLSDQGKGNFSSNKSRSDEKEEQNKIKKITEKNSISEKKLTARPDYLRNKTMGAQAKFKNKTISKFVKPNTLLKVNQRKQPTGMSSNKKQDNAREVNSTENLLNQRIQKVPDKAYKQIVHDVANFIKREEKKIATNLTKKYKDSQKNNPATVNEEDSTKQDQMKIESLMSKDDEDEIEEAEEDTSVADEVSFNTAETLSNDIPFKKKFLKKPNPTSQKLKNITFTQLRTMNKTKTLPVAADKIPLGNKTDATRKVKKIIKGKGAPLNDAKEVGDKLSDSVKLNEINKMATKSKNIELKSKVVPKRSEDSESFTDRTTSSSVEPKTNTKKPPIKRSIPNSNKFSYKSSSDHNLNTTNIDIKPNRQEKDKPRGDITKKAPPTAAELLKRKALENRRIFEEMNKINLNDLPEERPLKIYGNKTFKRAVK